MALPEEEVQGFLDQVDEVDRLISGLKAGTISPEYIDKKLDAKKPATSSGSQRGRPSADAGLAADKPDQDAPGGGAGAPEADAARQAELKRKVHELKCSRERKLRARARFQEYVAAGAVPQPGTDYHKWDLWCPSDEEDELFASLTPNDPGLRAMEADINARHKKMVERRQLAERQRVAGNAAFKAGQYSEALRCYETGLDAQRHNMALHANAAMAALKLRCYVQALEHCSKVLHLADLLHGNMQDALCFKAYQRRAAAYQALGQPDKAVADLEAAAAIEPSCPEIAKQLARSRTLHAEEREQRRVSKLAAHQAGAAGGHGGGGSGDGASAGLQGVAELRQVEQLTARLRQAGGSAAGSPGVSPGGNTSACGDGTAAGQVAAGAAEAAGTQAAGAGCSGQGVEVACRVLRGLLEADSGCRAYFRQCGGMEAAAAVLRACSAGGAALQEAGAPPRQGPQLPARGRAPQRQQQQGGGGAAAALLLLLNATAHSEACLEDLAGLGALGAAMACLSDGDSRAAAAAALLLATAATNEAARQQLCGLLCRDQAAGLEALLRLLDSGPQAAQSPALQALSNCLLSKQARASLAGLLRSRPQLLAGLECALGHGGSGGGGGGAAGGCAPAAAQVLDLLTNLSGDAGLRALLASQHGALVDGVCELAAGPRGTQAEQRVQVAALGCLCNLCLEPAVQARLAARPALLRIAALAAHVPGGAKGGQPAGGSGVGSPDMLASRAARVVSRLARDAQAAAALRAWGAVGRLAAGLAAGGCEGAGEGAGAGSAAAAATWREATVRCLAALTSDAAWVAGCGAAAARELAAALLVVLGQPGVPAAVAGNACLCLSHLASHEPWLPLLGGLDVVAPLVRVAHAGRGDAASKNAAIALAKAARHPPMLERLRELHGLEIIYQYVRP